MPNSPDEGTIKNREEWFRWYTDKLDNNFILAKAKENGEAYKCPCCYQVTLTERGSYEICPVCFWEDDGQDEADADTVRGGPNGKLSLTQARQNYLEFGACENRLLEFVRPPKPEKI